MVSVGIYGKEGSVFSVFGGSPGEFIAPNHAVSVAGIYSLIEYVFPRIFGVSLAVLFAKFVEDALSKEEGVGGGGKVAGPYEVDTGFGVFVFFGGDGFGRGGEAYDVEVEFVEFIEGFLDGCGEVYDTVFGPRFIGGGVLEVDVDHEFKNGGSAFDDVKFLLLGDGFGIFFDEFPFLLGGYGEFSAVEEEVGGFLGGFEFIGKHPIIIV